MAKLTGTLCILAALVLTGTASVNGAPNGLVIILTDYGDVDHYVGMLKGAIYSVSTDLKVDTITNEVWPFDVPDGAFMLYEAAALFPPGTTFVAIVDPGSGKDRMPIALKTKDGKYFVGPDNGILDLVADRMGADEIRLIANHDFMRKEAISGMFHGYDMFGPAAAHIAAGAPFDKIGPVIAAENRISLPEASLEDDGSISGDTLYIDHYGNLTTNIVYKQVKEAGYAIGDMIPIKVGIKKIEARFAENYGEGRRGALVCIIDNGGFLELAVNQGSFVNGIDLKTKPPIIIESRKKDAKGKQAEPSPGSDGQNPH